MFIQVVFIKNHSTIHHVWQEEIILHSICAVLKAPALYLCLMTQNVAEYFAIEKIFFHAQKRTGGY